MFVDVGPLKRTSIAIDNHVLDQTAGRWILPFSRFVMFDTCIIELCKSHCTISTKRCMNK